MKLCILYPRQFLNVSTDAVISSTGIKQYTVWVKKINKMNAKNH